MKKETFSSLMELMDYVNTEAERRIKERGLTPKSKSEGSDIEDKILLAMDRPMCASTLSVLLDIPMNKLLHHLRRMQKWGVIKPVTQKKVIFWDRK